MQEHLFIEISELEECLRVAMMHSDVEALTDLLAPDLFFTNHLGQTFSGVDDIQAHRSGQVHIFELQLSEMQIQMRRECAVVSVRAHIKGSYFGHDSVDDLRFTRIWQETAPGRWQVVAGHSSAVVA